MFLSNNWTQFKWLCEDKLFLVLALKGLVTARCFNGHYFFFFSTIYYNVVGVVVQSLSCPQLFATPPTAAQPLSSTVSQSLLIFTSIELVML